MSATTRRTVRVDDGLWEEAQAAASERGDNLSDVIREALRVYVGKPCQQQTGEAMTNLQFAASATHDAIVVYPDTPKVLKFNIASMLLAKESGTIPGGFTEVDLDAPLDERITWTEQSDDERLTITGTLDAQP